MPVTSYCSARTKEGRACSSVATSSGFCPAHKPASMPAAVLPVPAAPAPKLPDPVARLKGRKVKLYLQIETARHVVGRLVEAWPYELVLEVLGGSVACDLAEPGRRIFLKHAVIAVEEIP
ncbi:MAG: hypothetical protein IT186_16040 [Acidobacteria bacterium]|nr:hypothetical protein [Acidobacteriota bacterium]